uniref:uncharacterized protein LOC122607268 n=1 Tax=Erigeron canadensis TaxID=72917 RepID=UPI001CB93EBC|nr:uncharacterized protein LOC122607268 [Erigeron canadensis]XP_043636140.1 uncharacterized protein LOC122607268 [Erigeron canadensis]
MVICRKGQTLFSSSISHGYLFKSPLILHIYTTLSSFHDTDDGPPKPHSAVVEFLMDSVGFTRETAIAASNKVPSLKSTKNPELVINIFKQYGLDNTHMKQIISCAPKILNCRPNTNLEPKFRFFRDNGFSGSDLVDLIKRNPYLLVAGLDTHIIPFIGIIRKLVGTNEEAMEVVKKSKSLFLITSPAYLKKMSSNVFELQNRGLSNKKIVYLVSTHPRIVVLTPLVFRHRIGWIVEKLGIPETSPMFVYAIAATVGSSKLSLEKKLDILRSYKWGEEEIATFVRTFPTYFGYSEAKICDALNFFMKDLRFAPAYLVTNNFLLGLSLEKRVKPRCKVWEMLKDKKLIPSKPSLASLLVYSELKFLKFLERFENELPGLIETYTNSNGKTQTKKGMA